MDLSNLEYVERDGVRYEVVEVRDFDGCDWQRRIQIHSNMCVSNFEDNEDRFVKGFCSFDVTTWKQVRPLPKKHYVPFTMEDAHLFRDRWVKFLDAGFIFKISIYDVDGIGDRDGFLRYSVCLDRLTFDDGTPFGKEVSHE